MERLSINTNNECHITKLVDNIDERKLILSSLLRERDISHRLCLQMPKRNPDVLPFSLEQHKNIEQLDNNICQQYSRDLSHGLLHMSDNPTGYPEDMIKLEHNIENPNLKTSPTNIGLYLTSMIASRDMQIVSAENANSAIDKLLSSLEKAKTDHGLFYNWYDTQTGDVLDSPDGPFISTVDNAWLAAGLMTLRNASDIHTERSNRILNKMDFQNLYDKDENLFYGGYNPDNKEPTNWHYDIFNTEGRIASYVGISNFGIPPINYRHLGECTPAKIKMLPDAIGQYHKSWGGSMFEMLMPTLLVPEEKMNLNLKDNITRYIQSQIEYGDKHDNGYWGYSPCYSPSGYSESGIPDLAIKENGYGTEHIITPHAILLSLPFIPEQAVDMLERLKNAYPIYKKGYGFDDSVNIETGETAEAYLSLDQSMGLIALCNHLSKNGGIRKYFLPELEKMQGVINSLGYSQPAPEQKVS